jgi:hypothetical protein
MSRKPTDSNAITAHRFASLVAAAAPLRQHADDWAEGFSASTDLDHTIGGTTGDSRVVGEAIAGMKDHVENRVTRQVEETTVPLREGHGLATECERLADDIEEWIAQGNRLARRALRLMPVDHPVAMTMAKHQEVRLAGAGPCNRCGRDVPGIVESAVDGTQADRLKSGFCFGQPPHCYEAWRRTGMRDRKKFIDDWHAESGTDETPASAANG